MTRKLAPDERNRSTQSLFATPDDRLALVLGGGGAPKGPTPTRKLVERSVCTLSRISDRYGMGAALCIVHEKLFIVEVQQLFDPVAQLPEASPRERWKALERIANIAASQWLEQGEVEAMRSGNPRHALTGSIGHNQ